MRPTSLKELKAIVLGAERLIPRGSGSKSGLRGMADGTIPLDITGLAGIIEYDPSEYTFTAWAGTRLDEVEKTLLDNGQYLPFDPVLVERGATLGGTVAAGLSGPGRYQYGGVRDFLLGVKFVNGEGESIQGGGKVVKNAAGFDLPKLMVGSLGQFGALVELTFKVFPRPQAFTTIAAEFRSLESCLSALFRLAGASMELHAVDLLPGEDSVTLLVRLGGFEDAFPERETRVRELLKRGHRVQGDDELNLWHTAREFGWVPEGNFLVKVPITPKRVPALENSLSERKSVRRYSVGANVAWVTWSGEIENLNNILFSLNLSGLVVLGLTKRPYLGKRVGRTFEKRIIQALDPTNRWVEV